MAKPEKKRLGDLLVESNLITDIQLQEALRVQRDMGVRLGQALIQLGFVTQQSINEVLEFQLGIPQVQLHKLRLDPRVVKIISGDLARRHKVVPIERTSTGLRLAMADPLNLVAFDDVKMQTSLEVEPVIAMEIEIDRVISRFFGLTDTVKQAFGDQFQEMQKQDQGITDTIDLDELANATDEAPIAKAVNAIIQQSIKEKASDIHIEPAERQVRVRYRIDGILQDMMDLPKQTQASLVSRIKIMADMDISEKRVPQDGRIQIKSGNSNIDLRISTLPTIFGEKVVIRLLDKSNVLYSIQELGMDSDTEVVFKNSLKQTYGVILITGPTGSGKTTTLYAALNEINDAQKNIVTVEDPVEYVLDRINQVQVNTKAGMTFAGGLRSILRQDPDIIMVGEIRDKETAEIAIRSATTGHLVLSTLHTNDAASTITRLLDLEIEPFLVASAVVGVLAQRLVRTICPDCKRSFQLPEQDPWRLFLGASDTEPITLYKGNGCSFCNNTGYKGRTAIHEFMPVTKEIRNLVARKASADVIKDVGRKEGMITLKEDGIKKAFAGKTTLQEIVRVSYNDEK
ncbi:type II secretion system protein GspE [Desulfuribacillus stibiiarsenatis]|uniref:Type II secretion system protein GspE n=1 Tax=Desulfuribacillus stibiiarsenatis TaxID=1390249 RepID=A0A1E5L262_9FIRM|nr:ATPase, T2SS/T4P/T4SS family [Desulfuribacillus stibiiarsenatis]OEH84210.1 type II secretion system protein GspE [Desulfuribacillus stibiiarsenatis]